jgi:hypothetical protein
MELTKEMERRMEAAMELMKILNLDIGREFKESKTLLSEMIRKIYEKVYLQDIEEFGSIMRGTRVSIRGKEQVKRKWRKERFIQCRSISMQMQECKGKTKGHHEESWDLCFCSVIQEQLRLCEGTKREGG